MPHPKFETMTSSLTDNTRVCNPWTNFVKEQDTLLQNLKRARDKDLATKARLESVVKTCLEECLANNELLLADAARLMEESKSMGILYEKIDQENDQFRQNSTNESSEISKDLQKAHRDLDRAWKRERELKREREGLRKQLKKQQQQIKSLEETVLSLSFEGRVPTISNCADEKRVILELEESILNHDMLCPLQTKSEVSSTVSHPRKPETDPSIESDRQLSNTWHAGSTREGKTNVIVVSRSPSVCGNSPTSKLTKVVASVESNFGSKCVQVVQEIERDDMSDITESSVTGQDLSLFSPKRQTKRHHQKYMNKSWHGSAIERDSMNNLIADSCKSPDSKKGRVRKSHHAKKSEPSSPRNYPIYDDHDLEEVPDSSCIDPRSEKMLFSLDEEAANETSGEINFDPEPRNPPRHRSAPSIRLHQHRGSSSVGPLISGDRKTMLLGSRRSSQSSGMWSVNSDNDNKKSKEDVTLKAWVEQAKTRTMDFVAEINEVEDALPPNGSSDLERWLKGGSHEMFETHSTSISTNDTPGENSSWTEDANILSFNSEPHMIGEYRMSDNEEEFEGNQSCILPNELIRERNKEFKASGLRGSRIRRSLKFWG